MKDINTFVKSMKDGLEGYVLTDDKKETSTNFLELK
jgi:hypothetical protein